MQFIRNQDGFLYALDASRWFHKSSVSAYRSKFHSIILIVEGPIFHRPYPIALTSSLGTPTLLVTPIQIPPSSRSPSVAFHFPFPCYFYSQSLSPPIPACCNCAISVSTKSTSNPPGVPMLAT